MKQLALVLVVFLAWSGALAQAQRSAWIQGRETTGAERRVALVIGNSAYDRSMGRLINPVNDAEDMARTLRSLGFEVSHQQNLNRQSPGTFRLPSEAQWEYACRSGGKKVTYGTDTGLLSRRNANYGKNKCCLGDSSDGFKNSAPVGSFPPNALGLYDMSGNIREWVQDLRTLYIKLKAAKNPVNEQLGTNRVTRGGNYYYHPDDLRCTKRRSSTPTRKSVFVGFRLIKVR